MKFGILSDTHGYFHPAFREVFADVDYIIHAGDIGRMSVLTELQTIAPTIAVRGNIDGEEFFDLEKIARRKYKGISLAVIHNAGDIIHPSYDMHRTILSEPVHLLVSGHYHGYWCTNIDSRFGRVLWLSPGAAGNSGHHQERTALKLTVSDYPGGDILKDAKLEKINLGPRNFDD